MKKKLVVLTGAGRQSAAGLYRYAPQSTPIYIIDPAEVPIHESRITHIRKTATEGMKEIINILPKS